ncbi:MAG: AAC(3) family N-acetyltransferase [Verrucomicrobia bacterium]|nr:AAC(3) family N-acetyltransferase [Verrucomicrobiota bacterium]
MTSRSPQQLATELKSLGLRPGGAVMMHSSLSALGHVQGGADAVVDALLDAVGGAGTLLVPAFRDNVWGDPANFANTDCGSCPQRLCPSQQPGFQGAIAEAVRRRTGSLRSCHPTHSWVALGPAAERLLAGHHRSTTPCGDGNPFQELLALDGWLLLLGVGVNTVTLWHYYEELLEVPYMGHHWPTERHLNHCVPGRRIQYDFPGIMHDVCRAAGILSTGPVGKSTSGLMRAREFDSFMATIMSDDPHCLVLRPPDRNSGDLAVDALHKAARMLAAWRRGPSRVAKKLHHPPSPTAVPGPQTLVREDCPAFAGYHHTPAGRVPLCRANDRHPNLFRLGGIFNQCGVATCHDCVWHENYPPQPI